MRGAKKVDGGGCRFGRHTKMDRKAIIERIAKMREMAEASKLKQKRRLLFEIKYLDYLMIRSSAEPYMVADTPSERKLADEMSEELEALKETLRQAPKS